MKTTLTARGIIIIALSMALLIIGNILQSYLSVAMVSIFVFYFLAYVVYLSFLPEIDVTFTGKARHGILYRGELEVIQLKITNKSSKSLPSVKIKITLPPDIFPVNQSNVVMLSLSAGQTKTINIPLLPLKRGYFEISPITAHQMDIFGVFATPLATIPSIPVRIYPKRLEAHVNELRVKEVFSRLTDVYAIRRKGMGEDFHGLREYIRGDPSKIIYWPAVARRGKLISKEFEDEKQLEVIVALQGGTTMRGQKFDFVLGTAMDIYSGILEQGHPVGFLFFDTDVKFYFKPSKSRKQQLRIWGEIYSETAKDVYVNFNVLAKTLEKEKITNKLFIFIGDLEYNVSQFLNLLRKIVMMKNNLIFVDVRGFDFSYRKRLTDVAKTYTGEEYGKILQNIIANNIIFDEVFRGIYVSQEMKRFNAVYAYIQNEKETIVDVLDRAMKNAFRRW